VAAFVACDERPTRWEIRRQIILPLVPCEAVLVEDRELVHRRLPAMRRPAPVSGDIAQRQPDQLAGRVVGGKVAARLDDLAQLRVHALDRVRGVDHPPHRRREREERDHVRPCPAPGGDHGREFLAPRPGREVIELGLGRLGAGRRVDGPDRRGQGLSLLPAGVIEAIAHQVHDARLQRRFGIDHGQGFGHSFQSVGDRDQDVGHAPCPQVVEHLHPELGPFGALDPQPQDLAAAVGLHAHGQVDGLVAHHVVLADLHRQRVKEHHRIHRLQRPGLPGGDFSVHRVGDPADEVRCDVGAIHLGQKALDLTHRHAAGVHGDDLVIEPRKAAFVLANQLGFELARPIARDLDAYRTVVGEHRLGALAIAMVGRAGRLVGAGGVAQVVAHFGTQGALDQRLLEGRRRLLHRLGAHRSLDELVEQLRRDLGQHRRLRGRVGFLHLPYWLWHTCSFQTTWYASHTKLLTGS